VFNREIFGWIAYDWANSAFYTTVITVLIGPYLQALAIADVGEDGVVADLGWLGVLTPKSLFTMSLVISNVSQALFLPILGSLADYTHLKKKLLVFFSYSGVFFGGLLFFITGDDYLWGFALLILSNMSFVAANVLYNAFLNDVAEPDKRDKVSSWGYAAGYLGGVVMLAGNLAVISMHESLGLSKGEAVRYSMLAASLWWGLFGLITFFTIQERKPAVAIPGNKNLLTVGFSELWATLKELKSLKYTLFFLLGYLLYNDGIQTVISNSSVYLANELFVSKGLETDEGFLLLIFLLAQFCAFAGAMVFERVARVFGPKNTILFCLMIWIGIVVYAYAYMESQYQAWFLGAGIGLVLGSTQALSRSLFSRMIPKGREAAFFSIYELSERGTSWIGNLVFGIVVIYTGSFRQAILALIFFFVSGSIILIFTDVQRAMRDAALSNH
jgi:MFS transporter, UMF1 family